MNQIDLAVHTGLSRSYISMMETGATTPSLPTVEVLALAFDISLSQLFKDV